MTSTSSERATRLSDAIATRIEQRILEGTLKPGDRLPSERELAASLGVSRPSVREAIHRLVAKGLLHTRERGGTQVTDRLAAHFTDPWVQMLAGHPDVHRDMLEFRALLESQAAYWAADRCTDVDIQLLDAAHATLQAQYDGAPLDECVDADLRFHQAIAETSHNVLVSHLCASLMKVSHGHISDNLRALHPRPHRWEQLRGQHRDIWLAIRERRPEDAARATRAHIDFVRQSMEENALAQERRAVALRRSANATLPEHE
ncbi:FadR/GntR family transcriptional regulator [Ramlibacter alkalitolerans]|uniref:Pyruvate dehydrogenase complex repressor n=1 Tax=Ramlibacter alkalitolerans TaxID=2039631 RepID=A0ABS1JPR6_9BURK|nr:GntR family transcriptional regulator [Ramlibacter alkalitolerans]